MRADGTLIGAGGDDDIAGLDRAMRCLRNEPERIAASPQPCYLDIATDRRRDEGCIGGDEIDDLIRGRKAVGVRVRKGKIRQPHRPVRKLKPQPVPTLASPALGDAAALQDQMRKSVL